MSNLLERAKELGELVKESEEFKTLLAAKEAFEADEEAKSIIIEYNDFQKKLYEKMRDKNASQEEIGKLKEEGEAIRVRIEENSVTSDLLAAQKVFTNVLNSVYETIQTTVTGRKGCGGNCGSCGGCE